MSEQSQQAGERPPVLVTGATGSTGAAVWAALARRGVPARAMVRRSSDADRFTGAGTGTGASTSAVVADLDDAASLAAALAGVQRAYLVTPSSEQAQARQVRFVEAAADAGVQHLAVLSQLGAADGSPVRFLRYHAAVERRVVELGLGHTFLRPNLFFQGLLAFREPIAASGQFFAPIGDARVSAVDVADIGEVAATALAADDPDDATLTITGPEGITHAEMAAALGDALGREVRFVDVGPQAFAEALAGVLPPWQVAGLVEDYAHYRRGEAEATTSVVSDVTGRPAHPFAEWAAASAGAFA